MIRSPLFFCAFLFTLLSHPPFVRAETPEISVSATSCGDLSLAEIERILNMEVRTVALGRKEVQSAPTQVTVHCSSQTLDLEVRVRGEAEVFAERLQRSSGRYEEGTERLVAIAATELIFSAWVTLLPPTESEPGSNGKEMPESGQETSPANTNEPVDGNETGRSSDGDLQIEKLKSKRELSISLGPHWRMYTLSTMHLFGGELTLRFSLLRLLVLRIGGALEGGKTEREAGKISLLSGSGLFSVGIELSGEIVAGTFEVGGRFGAGSIKGTASEDDVRSQTVNGGIGGPLARLGIRLGARVPVALTVESGYAFYGNTGRVSDDTPIHMKGAYISVALSIVVPLISK